MPIASTRMSRGGATSRYFANPFKGGGAPLPNLKEDQRLRDELKHYVWHRTDTVLSSLYGSDPQKTGKEKRRKTAAGEIFSRPSSSSPFAEEKLQHHGLNDSADLSLYTGVGGVVITFVKLALSPTMDILREPTAQSRAIVNLLRGYIAKTVLHSKADQRDTHPENSEQSWEISRLLRKGLKQRHAASFLCGATGVAAVATISAYLIRPSEVHLLQTLMSGILAGAERACDSAMTPADEVIYGRAGVLLGLMWLEHCLEDIQDFHLAPNAPRWFRDDPSSSSSSGLTPVDLLTDRLRAVRRSLVAAIIASGRHGAQLRQLAGSGLRYEWHEKEYLGAAHGYAGILYALLAHWQMLSGDKEAQTDVLSTVEWLMQYKLSNGNFASSLPLASDNEERLGRLVQWCHGAPGFTYLLTEASRQLPSAAGQEKTKEYVELAEWSGTLAIWKGGLLRKGPGVCHGTPGNGYSFLKLLKITGKEEYYRYASSFAYWLLSEEAKELETYPDEPFSLFEGMCGAMAYVSDVLDCLPALPSEKVLHFEEDTGKNRGGAQIELPRRTMGFPLFEV